MGLVRTAVLTGLAWAFAAGAVLAHHSFAMFDTEHPIEIAGTVREFRWVAPHTVLVVEVKGQDGTVEHWTLEGGTPSLLRREGMTATSLKPGEEIVVRVNPLRSGAPGGSYQAPQVRFRDGRPVVAPH
jgi:Family of unknown function (DUF6152)